MTPGSAARATDDRAFQGTLFHQHARARLVHLELEYETFGSPSSPTVLLIGGLGSQLLSWSEGLCLEIASRGFHVVRYDNRDIGLSTDLGADASYTLSDMAADAVGLLDQIGVARAHVVGASMGGMIAQLVAVNHPERVLTLTSVMSDLGGEDSVLAELEVLELLVMPPPRTREERIEQSVAIARVTWGPSFDEERSRARSTQAVDRSYRPQGAARQLAAIAATPSRREALGSLTIPVLVIHGDADPLIPFANAARVTSAVPTAELMVMEGVGHEMPPWEWPRIADRIAALAQRALAVPKLKPGNPQVGVAER